MCISRGNKAGRAAKRRIFPAALIGCALCLFLSACGNQPTLPQDPSAPLYESAAPDPSELYSVDFRLTSGHHTAGVDFPAGTYHLEAIQWCGTVSSSNGSVDEAMGVTDYNTDGLNQYIQELSAVELPAGTVLSLTGGVMLRMTCGDADPTPLTARNQEITESVTLTAGIYTAGQDFPAGVYDFTATDGVGNVESSNPYEEGISDVMGTTWRLAEDFGFCDQYYQNVSLPEGTVLRVSGVTLLLTPSE